MFSALQATTRYPLAIGALTFLSRQKAVSPLEEREKDSPYPLPPPPEEWSQRPLWVRATPGSSTRVLRVRKMDANGNERILPLGAQGAVPVNSGTEEAGQSSLIDFETDQFVGTILFLIKGAPPLHSNTNNNNDNNESHFDNTKATFHAVIQGRFKKPHPLQTAICGQVFRRPAGRQLPHWMMHRLVMPLINRLAPHNSIDLECSRPYYWAPLASMAQMVAVLPEQKHNHNNLPSALELERALSRTEPHASDPSSIVHPLATPNNAPSSPRNLIKRLTASARRITLPALDADGAENIKARKKIMRKYLDDVVQQQESTKQSTILWDPDKEYLFGIHNHWIQFNDPTRNGDLALDLRVPFLRHIALAPCTDGQPVVLMAALLPASTVKGEETLNLGSLWSFEVWQESLYPAAQQHHSAVVQ